MLNVINAIGLDLQRAAEISLRKDAGREHRGRSRSSEFGASAGAFRFGERARGLAAAGGEPSGTPEAPESQRSQVPLGRNSDGLEVLKRAVRSYDDSQSAGIGVDFDAPKLRLRPGAEVPFETLQRVSSGQGPVEDGSPSVPAAGARAVPFDVLQRAAGAAEFSEPAPPEETFAVPEAAGAPFGRDVPFDMAAPRRSQDGGSQLNGESPAGSLPERMRAELASERYQFEEQRFVPLGRSALPNGAAGFGSAALPDAGQTASSSA